MSHVRTKYIVYNHNGTGVRHHHFTSANDVVAETNDNYPGSTDANPGTHTCYAFQESPNINHYPFAFMSVHRNTDDAHLFTSSGNYSIQVGSSDVDVLIVYGPIGGTRDGLGHIGVWVDAFNIDTGDFSDDLNFITILTPPNSSDENKTNLANAEGTVVTEDGAEILRASDKIDRRVPFLKWKKIIPTEFIGSSKDISLKQNENGEIWFAFYQTIPADIAITNLKDVFVHTKERWEVDYHCGTPHGPHVPHGPLSSGDPVFRLNIDKETIKSLPESSQNKLANYIEQYPKIAKNAYLSLTKLIDTLDDIGKIVSKTPSNQT